MGLGPNRLYLVETLVTFRHRYLVEATSASDATDAIAANEASSDPHPEWQQRYLGESPFRVCEVSEQDIETLERDCPNDGPYGPHTRYIIRADHATKS